MTFKMGDKCYTKAIGYGLVTYEEQEVESVTKRGVKLYNLDTLYDPETGIGAGPSLGLEIRLCITKAEIEKAKRGVQE
jgi:hypothetical protein